MDDHEEHVKLHEALLKKLRVCSDVPEGHMYFIKDPKPLLAPKLPAALEEMFKTYKEAVEKEIADSYWGPSYLLLNPRASGKTATEVMMRQHQLLQEALEQEEDYLVKPDIIIEFSL